MRVTEQSFQNRADFVRLHPNLLPHLFRFFHHQPDVSLRCFQLPAPVRARCAVQWLRSRVHTREPRPDWSKCQVTSHLIVT